MPTGPKTLCCREFPTEPPAANPKQTSAWERTYKHARKQSPSFRRGLGGGSLPLSRIEGSRIEGGRAQAKRVCGDARGRRAGEIIAHHTNHKNHSSKNRATATPITPHQPTSSQSQFRHPAFHPRKSATLRNSLAHISRMSYNKRLPRNRISHLDGAGGCVFGKHLDN